VPRVPHAGYPSLVTTLDLGVDVDDRRVVIKPPDAVHVFR
jgi:hypothetical protein